MQLVLALSEFMYCVLVVGVVEVLDLLYCVLGFDVLSNGLWTGYLCTV